MTHQTTEEHTTEEPACLSTGAKLTDLPPNLRALIDGVRREPGFTPSLARDLLAASDVTPEDLVHWAEFDHPAADSYGRRLVWDGGCFELMVMSWVDGDMAAIHDHGYTQWGAVKLFGPAEHAIFKMRDGRLTTCERRDFEAGDVVSVAHDLIHQMGNMGHSPFLSLHLYGCYGREGDITADARLYELDQGLIQRTSGGVFFGLPEEAVNAREPDLQADAATSLRHKVELLRRTVCATGSEATGSFTNDLERRLAAELLGAELWQNLASELEGYVDSESTACQRSHTIALREIAATGDLLSRLHGAGLVSHPVAADLPLSGDLESRATTFSERLAEHFGVRLELPVAA